MLGLLLPLLLILHVAVCVLLVIVVLMQRPRSEGLGAAFGGGMTENIFGAQTSQVLAKFTTYLGIVFFGLTLLLAIIYAKISTGRSSIQKELEIMSMPLKASPSPALPSLEATPPEVAPSSLEESPSPILQSTPVESPFASPAGSPVQVP